MTQDPGASTVAAAQLASALRAVCAGPVLAPDQDGYIDAVRGMILSVDRRPALVLLAQSSGDLVAAIGAAARFGAAVGVLATGHATRAIADVDLLVVTSALRGVHVDPDRRTARIEPGAVWGEVLAATEPHGLVALSGSHATVGAVGYTLGGGLGTLARSHGFAADRVRSFEVVTAAGDLVTADAAHHPELFRALRGGGREGIALVAAMTIELVPMADVYGGSIVFSVGTGAEAGAAAESLFSRYLEWTRSVSEQLTSSLAIVRVPDIPEAPEDIRGLTLIQLDLCHAGPGEQAAAECAGIEGWGAVIRSDLRRRPFSELAIDGAPAPGWGGALALREVTEQTLGRLLDAVGPGRPAPFVFAQLRHLGGAMGRGGAAAGTIAGRDAAYILFLAGAPVPELIDGPIPGLADEIFVGLAQWGTGTLPTNYADHLDRRARESSWSPAELAELAEIRRRWDPAGMFAGWAG